LWENRFHPIAPGLPGNHCLIRAGKNKRIVRISPPRVYRLSLYFFVRAVLFDLSVLVLQPPAKRRFQPNAKSGLTV
jgi:hypothetical protein